MRESNNTEVLPKKGNFKVLKSSLSTNIKKVGVSRVTGEDYTQQKGPIIIMEDFNKTSNSAHTSQNQLKQNVSQRQQSSKISSELQRNQDLITSELNYHKQIEDRSSMKSGSKSGERSSMSNLRIKQQSNRKSSDQNYLQDYDKLGYSQQEETIGIEAFNNRRVTEKKVRSKSEIQDYPDVVVKGLITLLNQARLTESYKMDLACNPDFNFQDAFSLLCIQDKHGTLCTAELLLEKIRELNPGW